MEASVFLLDETVTYLVKFPDVECVVDGEQGASSDWVKGSKTGQRMALLTNGQRVKVPHHINPG